MSVAPPKSSMHASMTTGSPRSRHSRSTLCRGVIPQFDLVATQAVSHHPLTRLSVRMRLMSERRESGQSKIGPWVRVRFSS